jgi:dihydrofolate reductase
MERVIIAAYSENRTLGMNGATPWKISADLKRFKELTMGHPILMGRKTAQSLSKPLSGRLNIIVTKDDSFFHSIPYSGERVAVCHSVESALEYASCNDEQIGFIIGGGEVFRYAMKRGLVDRIEATVVHATYEGDTFFPEINPDEWNEVNNTPHNGFSYLTYLKR